MPFLIILSTALLLDEINAILLLKIDQIWEMIHMLILANLFKILITHMGMNNQEKDFLGDIHLRLNSIRYGHLLCNETNYFTVELMIFYTIYYFYLSFKISL